jgi:hypothetical protein
MDESRDEGWKYQWTFYYIQFVESLVLGRMSVYVLRRSYDLSVGNQFVEYKTERNGHYADIA